MKKKNNIYKEANQIAESFNSLKMNILQQLECFQLDLSDVYKKSVTGEEKTRGEVLKNRKHGIEDNSSEEEKKRVSKKVKRFRLGMVYLESNIDLIINIFKHEIGI